MGDEDEGGPARDNIAAVEAQVDEARYHPSNLTMQRDAKLNQEDMTHRFGVI